MYCFKHQNVEYVRIALGITMWELLKMNIISLVMCPVYEDIRNIYIVQILSKYNLYNERVTAILLKSEDNSVIYSVGLYLYYLFNVRTNDLDV